VWIALKRSNTKGRGQFFHLSRGASAPLAGLVSWVLWGGGRRKVQPAPLMTVEFATARADSEGQRLRFPAAIRLMKEQ
jgi:hypothetical protein